VPEVLRPLYESSKVVAQKMTIAVSSDFFFYFIKMKRGYIAKFG
jgi:hypothetical protein